MIIQLKVAQDFNLQPCPFCMSEDLQMDAANRQVECNYCGAMGPNRSSPVGAVNDWNARNGDEHE